MMAVMMGCAEKGGYGIWCLRLGWWGIEKRWPGWVMKHGGCLVDDLVICFGDVELAVDLGVLHRFGRGCDLGAREVLAVFVVVRAVRP
jgi:hypothetical protein